MVIPDALRHRCARMRKNLTFSLIPLLLAACGETPPPGQPDSGPDAAGDSGSVVDASADAALDAGRDGGSRPDGGGPRPDGGSPDGGGPDPTPVVRFVVLGDGGEGNETQYAVARAMETVCDRDGCEFALYLGDNIYDSGVDGPNDAQFVAKFENPYANLDFPFYVALGNHDYGGLGILPSAERGPHQIAYSALSGKWTMLDEYYSVVEGHATFYAIDTTSILWEGWIAGFNGSREAHEDWLADELANVTTPWKIAFGHHPYISNGKHGNAGEYEGIVIPSPDNVDGDGVRDFFEASICGQVDAYFCGHDHNRQWLGERCGTLFAVSGAAAKLDDLRGRGNDTEFEDASKAGFLWVELLGDTMTARFYDQDGFADFETQVTRPTLD